MGKTIDRMRANPKADWTIDDIEKACREVGLVCIRPSRGSHWKIGEVTGGRRYTIPARRPIKPQYIAEFLKFLNEIGRA